MRKKAYLLILFVSGLLSSCTAEKSLKSESDVQHDPVSTLVRIHQGPLNHLMAVRRGDCPMHPSCSEYSRQSVEKYGFLQGWVMTCDRLMRCGRDELKSAPRVLIDGKWKYYDPVESNDFER